MAASQISAISESSAETVTGITCTIRVIRVCIAIAIVVETIVTDLIRTANAAFIDLAIAIVVEIVTNLIRTANVAFIDLAVAVVVETITDLNLRRALATDLDFCDS
jgi:TctA family transporter